jgi:ubiquinone/menaquinone biosynthesis C-methylase UbiE
MKEKFWDIFSSKYDKITQGTNLTRDVEIEKSLKYIQSNHVALDYGCGTGTLANSIADKVQKVIAIDISSGMLEVAKKKAVEKQITNVEFLKISLFDEQLHQKYFDIIFAFNVLHFVEDGVKCIHRIHDILKPGGYFISSTECGGENKKSFINVVTSLLSSVRIMPYVRLLTKNELDSSIIDGGFEIVEREDFYNLNQPNHFVVAQKVQTT